MEAKLTSYLSFAISLFLLIGSGLSMRAQKKMDSLLKKGNSELYENPNKAIAIGFEIYNAQPSALEDKINALLLISTAYSSKRNYVKALDYAVKASNLLPNVTDDGFKINIYNKLGVQYEQLKIYDKAHSYLDQAIQIATNSNQKKPWHSLLGFNYAVRGLVYKEQMTCDIAQNYFNKSLFHLNHANDDAFAMNANLSVITYNKGYCFISLNQKDSAKICFTKSLAFAKEIKANSLQSFAYKGLAEVNTLDGKYNLAIQQLNTAMKISSGVGDLILNQGLNKGLADNYLVINNFEQYKRYNNKYHEIERQIKNNDTKTLHQFVLQLNEEHKKEIEGIESAALFYKIPLVLLLLGLLLLLFFENSKYQKKYIQLKKQRKELQNDTTEYF